MSDTIRCGCYQLRADHDFHGNVQAIERGIALAAEDGVRLLVFPELATSSLSVKGRQQKRSVLR